MWNLQKIPEQDLTFHSMDPFEILYEFDSAIIFTFKASGRLFLAYSSDEDIQKQLTRYLVVATDDAEIIKLKTGVVSTYQVLDKSYVWAVDRNFEDQFVTRFCIADGIAGVPKGYKPEKDVLLYSHLKPMEVIAREASDRAAKASGLYLEHSRAMLVGGLAEWADLYRSKDHKASADDSVLVIGSVYAETDENAAQWSAGMNLIHKDSLASLYAFDTMKSNVENIKIGFLNHSKRSKVRV